MPLRGLGRVKKAINNLESTLDKDLRGVYFAGLSAIIKETPVDSGRARNNWFLTVNAPSNKTTTAKSRGLGAIRQLSKMPKSVLGKTLYFTNNLPYAHLLEYGGFTKKPETDKTIKGFSKQAPNGFVRKNVIKMQNKLRKL